MTNLDNRINKCLENMDINSKYQLLEQLEEEKSKSPQNIKNIEKIKIFYIFVGYLNYCYLHLFL